MAKATHPISIAKRDNLDVLFLKTLNELTKHRLISPALGGSFSVKTSSPDQAGHEHDVLWISDALSPQEPQVILRQDLLKPLAELDGLGPQDLQFELDRCRLNLGMGQATTAALYHMVIPNRAVCLSTHPTFLAMGCLTEWEDLVSRVLGKEVLPVPYARSGFPLVKSLRQALPLLERNHSTAIYLRYHGLLAFGAQLEKVQAFMFALLERAQQFLSAKFDAIAPAASSEVNLEKSFRLQIAQLRKELSDKVKHPLLLRMSCNAGPESGTQNDRLLTLMQQGAASAVMAEQFAAKLLVGLEPDKWPVQISTLSEGRPLPASMLLIGPQMGIGATADRPKTLTRNMEIIKQNLGILSQADHFGTFVPVEPSDKEKREIQSQRVGAKEDMFPGEVALVTGAASGIGRACVDSFLERGAAVVGLDINEDILNLSNSAGYFGQVCDLTDEKAILQALEMVARTFGGLDMMILNAGIFPPSRTLETLSLEHWQQVMRINLDVNITLLREAFPLLKRAEPYGRVIINASRNVPAPGPGAAAYSASKAALTQLGRVAALEWGTEHVRVNIVHPNAVFDTGIWTEEVLESRAAKYGLTVEQYKANNVLGVELTSHDVAELMTEMCGPLFSKITGAQVPLDGGSDRVI